MLTQAGRVPAENLHTECTTYQDGEKTQDEKNKERRRGRRVQAERNIFSFFQLL